MKVHVKMLLSFTLAIWHQIVQNLCTLLSIKRMGTLKKIMEINIWRNKKRLGPTDESKDTLKKDEELCNKIRDLIRSIINNWDN